MAYGNEIYIDSSLGTDTGTGTAGDPYGNLAYAFTTEGTLATGTYRFNVKGTTYLAPETNLGTLPATSNNVQIEIAPYATAAGDTTDPVYLSADSASATPWVSTGDGLGFRYCYFFGMTGETARFIDLDNSSYFIDSTFEGCGVYVDSYVIIERCTFTDLTGAKQIEMAAGSECNNCVFITNTSNPTSPGNVFVNRGCVRNCIFIQNCEVNYMIVQTTNGGTVRNCTFYCTMGTPAGGGLRLEDTAVVTECYFEGFRTGVDGEPNSRRAYWQNLVFYDNVQNYGTDIPPTNMCHDQNDLTLVSSGLGDPALGDYSQSAVGVTANASLTGQTTVTGDVLDKHFGTAYSEPSSSGGGTTGRQGLHAIESGSV